MKLTCTRAEAWGAGEAGQGWARGSAGAGADVGRGKGRGRGGRVGDHALLLLQAAEVGGVGGFAEAGDVGVEGGAVDPAFAEGDLFEAGDL